MSQRRCQGRDRWRAAGTFTARPGEGTTKDLGGTEAVSRYRNDAPKRDPDALPCPTGNRAERGEGSSAIGVSELPNANSSAGRQTHRGRGKTVDIATSLFPERQKQLMNQLEDHHRI